MSEVIKIENITKIFKVGDSEVRALDNISFKIFEGEKVAITGPSGSGKSTLMNILGCLTSADSGNYWLSGEDVSKLPSNRLAQIRNKYIGFIFQTFNLLPRLSSLENVELPLLYAGNSNAKDRAREALNNVGLGDRIES